MFFVKRSRDQRPTSGMRPGQKPRMIVMSSTEADYTSFSDAFVSVLDSILFWHMLPTHTTSYIEIAGTVTQMIVPGAFSDGLRNSANHNTSNEKRSSGL